MFGIGGTELLVILLIALLVLGPQKLPGIARTIGKAMGEFRRVSTEFQRTLNTEVAMKEERAREDATTRPQKSPDTGKTTTQTSTVASSGKDAS